MRRKFALLLAATAAALFAVTVLPVRAADKEKEEESNEVEVKWADVPAAVQKTFEKEAPGVKIEEVDKETKDGKTIYEADVKVKDQTHEIKVGEDGKLISNKVEKDDDEKDEAKEKNSGGKKDKD